MCSTPRSPQCAPPETKATRRSRPRHHHRQPTGSCWKPSRSNRAMEMRYLTPPSRSRMAGNSWAWSSGSRQQHHAEAWRPQGFSCETQSQSEEAAGLSCRTDWDCSITAGRRCARVDAREVSEGFCSHPPDFHHHDPACVAREVKMRDEPPSPTESHGRIAAQPVHDHGDWMATER